MSKYDREVVIKKLIRKGLKVKYYPSSRELSHFEAEWFGIVLGIKCLGYLDFLGVPVMKKARKERKRQPRMSVNVAPPRGWSFAWFPNREDANEWIKKQQENKYLDIVISKATLNQTEEMDYRACVEGVV